MEQVTLDGHGYQVGPLRPDWGPQWADLACDACGATWTGPIGEPCWYCARARQLMLDHQAAATLTPPDVEPDDIGYTTAVGAWLDRMTIAAEAGIIARDELRRAWDKETRRGRRDAA